VTSLRQPVTFRFLLGTSAISSYAEGVRQFQPRVCFETLGASKHPFSIATLKGLGLDDATRESQIVATPSELRLNKHALSSQGFKANPGLEVANAFGVDQQLFKQSFDHRRFHARARSQKTVGTHSYAP